MIASLGLLKGAIQNQDSIIINILITGNSVFLIQHKMVTLNKDHYQQLRHKDSTAWNPKQS